MRTSRRSIFASYPVGKTASVALEAMEQYLVSAQSPSCAQQMHLQGLGAVAELEAKLARHYGMRYAVCVSNATTGLLAIALALDLKDGEFVTSPYTFGASIASWLFLGNRPVFADIDPQTLTLNPESARRAISPKTRALLAVDIYGNPSDSRVLRKLADEFGLWYVADAAQSLGASRDGLPANSCADALVISFTAGKVLFAGEGAAVLTDNRRIFERIVYHTQHPYRQKRDLGLTLNNEFGLNARIHPLAAVWANAVFGESLAALRSRQQRCFEVIRCLNALGLTEPIDFERKSIFPSYFRLSAAWRSQPQARRLRERLARRAFNVRVTLPPVKLIYNQPAFLAQFSGRFCVPARCVQAERQARHRFCLEEVQEPAKPRFPLPRNGACSSCFFRDP